METFVGPSGCLAGGEKPSVWAWRKPARVSSAGGAQAACCGRKYWEDQHPQAAAALWHLAEAHSQQDPTFRIVIAYTRLTAAEALRQLREQLFAVASLPAPSVMTAVLNRNG